MNDGDNGLVAQAQKIQTLNAQLHRRCETILRERGLHVETFDNVLIWADLPDSASGGQIKLYLGNLKLEQLCEFVASVRWLCDNTISTYALFEANQKPFTLRSCFNNDRGVYTVHATEGLYDGCNEAKHLITHTNAVRALYHEGE